MLQAATRSEGSNSDGQCAPAEGGEQRGAADQAVNVAIAPADVLIGQQDEHGEEREHDAGRQGAQHAAGSSSRGPCRAPAAPASAGAARRQKRSRFCSIVSGPDTLKSRSMCATRAIKYEAPTALAAGAGDAVPSQQQLPVDDPEHTDRRVAQDVECAEPPAAVEQHLQDERRDEERVEDELMQAGREEADRDRRHVAESGVAQIQPKPERLSARCAVMAKGVMPMHSTCDDAAASTTATTEARAVPAIAAVQRRARRPGRSPPEWR